MWPTARNRPGNQVRDDEPDEGFRAVRGTIFLFPNQIKVAITINNRRVIYI